MLSLIIELNAYYRTVPSHIKLVSSLPVVVMALWWAYHWHLSMKYPTTGIYSVRSYRKGVK